MAKKAAATDSQTEAQVWSARLSAAFNLWKAKGWPTAQQLEDSLAGIFPNCVKGKPPISSTDGGGFTRWDYSGFDQANYNLNLGAVQYMLAQSWDEFPSLHFATKPLNASEDLMIANERIAQILCDEADAAAECRIAMESAMTRGMFALEYGIGPDTPTADTTNVMKMSAAQVIASVIEPFLDRSKPPHEVVLSPGMDFVAISAAARAMFSDPVQAAALGLDGVAALMHVAQTADVMDEEEKKSPKLTYERCKPWVSAVPQGTFCLWDTSVTDIRKAAWVAFKRVYDEEEFRACEAFSAKARDPVKGVQPVKNGFSDGWGAVKYASMTDAQDTTENTKYIIWRIIDKRHLKQHYVAEGYTEFVEDDDAYPYKNEYDRPLLPNVYPAVFRTPIKTVRERPESSHGIAQLAPGWHMQIEFIKFESRALKAAKQTARIYWAGPGVDAAEITKLKQADDMDVIRGKNTGVQGESEVKLLQFNAPMPSEYQSSAQRCMFRFASAVRVPAVAFTGEPVANTLGQEQIALQGATTTQSDIIRQYESAYAEMAWGLLQLFRAYAPDEQVQAYLGADATTPRQRPIMGPDGQPAIGPDGMPSMESLPSLWEEWKSVSLDGHKFAARFASSTRAEDAVAVTMSQNYVALLRQGLNSLGVRLWSEDGPMKRLAKMMDQPDPVPYQASLAENAAGILQSGGVGTGKKGEDGQGKDGKENADKGKDPHGDNRKAGGGRGAPAVPGRQDRNEKPQTSSHKAAMVNRAHGAKA